MRSMEFSYVDNVKTVTSIYYDIVAMIGEPSCGKHWKFSFDLCSCWYAGVLGISRLSGVAGTGRSRKIIKPRGECYRKCSPRL
jgi:hypothetical protein